MADCLKKGFWWLSGKQEFSSRGSLAPELTFGPESLVNEKHHPVRSYIEFTGNYKTVLYQRRVFPPWKVLELTTERIKQTDPTLLTFLY